MRTFETTAIVSADRKMVIPMPPGTPAGAYHVVLVIEQLEVGTAGPGQLFRQPRLSSPAQLPGPRQLTQPVVRAVWTAGPASADFTFRRDDLYVQPVR